MCFKSRSCKTSESIEPNFHKSAYKDSHQDDNPYKPPLKQLLAIFMRFVNLSAIADYEIHQFIHST